MSRYPKALKKVQTRIFLSAKKSRLEGYEILIGASDYGKNSWWNYITLLEYFLNGIDRLRFAPAERSGAAEFPP